MDFVGSECKNFGGVTGNRDSCTPAIWRVATDFGNRGLSFSAASVHWCGTDRESRSGSGHWFDKLDSLDRMGLTAFGKVSCGLVVPYHPVFSAGLWKGTW